MWVVKTRWEVMKGTKATTGNQEVVKTTQVPAGAGWAELAHLVFFSKSSALCIKSSRYYIRVVTMEIKRSYPWLSFSVSWRYIYCYWSTNRR